MFGHVRNQIQVVKIEWEIAQLLATLGQPRAIEGIDSLANAIMGTEMPDHSAATTRDDSVYHPLRVIRHLL